jgi:2-polyprenyl-3-methyl-5-hydroxy-6-metoxy-1,4-benzoquinol methylase
MRALEAAERMWQSDTYSLTKVWDEMPSKLLHEEMVAKWVGQVDSVVDLGCGVGRYATALRGQYKTYQGYDITPAMITVAQAAHDGRLDVEFALVDVFNFQVDRHYDVALMIDVAQHMTRPLEAVQKMMGLWSADRYIFSVLVGDIKEELLHSTVIPISWLLGGIRDLDVRILNGNLVLVQDEQFASIFLEVTK